MSKKCLIVTGGTIDLPFMKEFLEGKRYDMVVAADAGLEMLRAAGVMPNEIVGDLDSVDRTILKEYENNSEVCLDVHQPEKDETDTELALMTAVKNGCDIVDMLGALGGRMDHAIGNIQLLYQFYRQGVEINIYDEKNRIYLLGKGKMFHREELYGRYVSFLPLTETVEGLTLKGFKYPLNHRTVQLGTSLCISNELNGATGIMELEHGVVICVESHD